MRTLEAKFEVLGGGGKETCSEKNPSPNHEAHPLSFCRFFAQVFGQDG